MPNIARRQLLETVRQSLAAMPGADPEGALAEALAAARLKDKPFYTPEETANVARALMDKAQAQFQASLAGMDAMIAEVEAIEAEGP